MKVLDNVVVIGLLLLALLQQVAQAHEVEGFVFFRHIKCKKGKSIKKFSSTEDDCFHECRDTESCNVASYDAKKEKCKLYKSCKKLKYYEDNEGTVSKKDRFVLGGRMDDATGYFTLPEGTVYLDGTPILNKAIKKVKTLQDCMNKCDQTNTCKAASWNGEENKCEVFSRGKRLYKADGPKRFAIKKKENTVV